MSVSRRLAPLMLVSIIGVTSGAYIFGPPLKQYRADTDGTFDPNKAVPHLPPLQPDAQRIPTAPSSNDAGGGGSERMKDRAREMGQSIEESVQQTVAQGPAQAQAEKK